MPCSAGTEASVMVNASPSTSLSFANTSMVITPPSSVPVAVSSTATGPSFVPTILIVSLVVSVAP